MYGHSIWQSIDQQGKFADPTRGQLNMDFCFYPVPVRAGEFDLARLVRPFRPVSHCLNPRVPAAR